MAAPTRSAVLLNTSIPGVVVLIDGANATAQDNVNSGGATVYVVRVDCTSNTAEDVYVCLYADTNPTVGTTGPDLCVKGYKGVVTEYLFEDGIPFTAGDPGLGTAFLSVAVVTEKAGTGTTDPTETVNLAIQLT